MITSHACKSLPSETSSITLYNSPLICLPTGKNILPFPVLTMFTAFRSTRQQVTFRVCTSESSVENSLSIKLSARAPEIAFSRSITKNQRLWSQNWLFISITLCIQRTSLNLTELPMNVSLACDISLARNISLSHSFCEIRSALVV